MALSRKRVQAARSPTNPGRMISHPLFRTRGKTLPVLFVVPVLTLYKHVLLINLEVGSILAGK